MGSQYLLTSVNAAPDFRFTSLSVPIVAIAFRLASGNIAIAGYLIAGLYALRGPKNAIVAFSLAWFFSALNQDLFPDTPLAALGRYWIIAMAAFSLLINPIRGTLRPRTKYVVIMTLIFSVFILWHSITHSRMPAVSILKSLSWAFTIITLLLCWSRIGRGERNEVSNLIYWLLIATMLLSLMVSFIPQGYLPRSNLLRGVINHSQALGVTMAILAVWATLNLIASRSPKNLDMGVVALSLVTIYLSGARTGLLAVIIAVSAVFWTAPQLSGKTLISLLPGLRTAKVQLCGFALIMAVAISAPGFEAEIQGFFNKSHKGVDTLQDAFKASRGGLYEEMKKNIDRNPWRGIGFGIASDPMSMKVRMDPFFGIPISAAVEKGILPVAVVEELGIPGGVLFFIWVAILVSAAASMGAFSLGILCTVLALNLGEALFFSVGGMGMLTMIMATRCVTSPSDRRPRTRTITKPRRVTSG